jgi:hypothetical protein
VWCVFEPRLLFIRVYAGDEFLGEQSVEVRIFACHMHKILQHD